MLEIKEERPKIVTAPQPLPLAKPVVVAPQRTVWKEPFSIGAVFVKYILPLMAVVGIVLTVYHVKTSRKVDEKTSPPLEPARSPFVHRVAGAGIIEAETENISIGSPVAGLVVKVSAKDWARVEPGTELFRLDDRQLQADKRVRESMLISAQSELARLQQQPRKEQIPVNQAQIDEAAANVSDMLDALTRTKELFAKHVTPEQELLTREQAYNAALARWKKAKADYDLMMSGAWRYDLDVAQASVAQAQAQLKSVETDIDRLIVRSYVKGQVLQVNVRPGEFVGAPANQALVVIGNIGQMHVRVDIDENDIPRFKAGQPARACIKGNPKDEFPLTFVHTEPYVIPKKSLTGQNTERVDTRVLQVIYALPPGRPDMYVGQQVDVFIDDGSNTPSASTPGVKLDSSAQNAMFQAAPTIKPVLENEPSLEGDKPAKP